MKVVSYMVPLLAAAAICAFGVLAADKQLPPVDEAVPVSNAGRDVNPVAVPSPQMREILDENPELVRWLLEVTATQGDDEHASAYQALSALAPIATAELIKELDNKNIKVRMAAMSCLAGCATSPTFPHQESLSKLLKIAQNEEEDETVRKLATLTMCKVICVIQGAPFSVSY